MNENYLSEIQEKRRFRRRRFLFLLTLLFAFLFLLGGAWIVAFSPVFQIKEISISGNQDIDKKDILSLFQAKILEKSPLNRILGFNNVLIWPKNFSAADLSLLPVLKSVHIGKDYNSRIIKAEVDLRKPYGIWCKKIKTSEEDGLSSDCFWFDENGVIFKKSLAAGGNLITVINDYSRNNLGLNSKILPDEFIPNLFNIFNVLSSSALSVKEIKLNDLNLKEMEVLTYDGPRIYFGLNHPAVGAASVIESFRIKPEFSRMEYLDFRIENRVYYK